VRGTHSAGRIGPSAHEEVRRSIPAAIRSDGVEFPDRMWEMRLGSHFNDAPSAIVVVFVCAIQRFNLAVADLTVVDRTLRAAQRQASNRAVAENRGTQEPVDAY